MPHLLKRRELLVAGTVLAFAGRPADAHDGLVHVSIKGMAFKPAKVEARVGERIEWTNNDPFTHTATVAGRWEVVIPPGAKATYRVTASDSVDYFCRFHPNMKGKIRVVS